MPVLREPFKAFEVNIEERVERDVNVIVAAEDISSVRELKASEIVDEMCDSAWNEMSNELYICNIRELTSYNSKEDDDPWVHVSPGNNYLSEMEIEARCEGWLEEIEQRKSAPLPGQLGIPGLDADVPK